MDIRKRFRSVSTWMKEAGLEKFSPKQRQYIAAGGLLMVLFLIVYIVTVFADSSDTKSPRRTAKKGDGVTITEGASVNPHKIDPASEWIGTAAVDIVKLKKSGEERQEENAELKRLSSEMAKRIGVLERSNIPLQQPVESSPVLGQNSTTPASGPSAPSTPIAGPGQAAAPGFPPGAPPPGKGADRARQVPDVQPVEEGPQIMRVSLSASPADEAPKSEKRPREVPEENKDDAKFTDTYLPVSFTRGRLLGGLDAPTGGQAQNNPLPVHIQLTDNAILPNQHRAEVKECFIVASAYGDISSERAYMRTDNLTCVRHDNSVLEVKIDGNVYGEDGKLGLRGRLVTKQGQLLANALRAGIVSGIGHGFSQGGSTFTTSPFGTLSTSPDGTGEQMKRGLARGVGGALDNLANYYIRLAEQMYPVIEIDSDRDVDVALTKGVRIPRTAEANADADLAEN